MSPEENIVLFHYLENVKQQQKEDKYWKILEFLKILRDKCVESVEKQK